MKWVNHSATAICVAMAVTGHPVISAAAAIASALPDKIEVFIPFGKHRGISHDPALWLPIIVVLLAMPFVPMESTSHLAIHGLFQSLAFGAAMGIGMHLITDAMSITGIPIFHKYRLAGNLYKTTALSEYIVSACICVTCILIAFARMALGINEKY
ncbi:MAG TPA: hypothetical protein PLL36_08650 [Candidatus Hydrogenedentes bacterium]|nr:hypothetical protein [Candidatus Hydrogenedentota bacterium]